MRIHERCINRSRVLSAVGLDSARLSVLRATPRGGYTLVEVLIAGVLVALVGLSTFAGIYGGMSAIQFAREEVRATQLLQEKLETLRLYTWTQLTTPGFVPTAFAAKANPTNANETAFYSGTVSVTNAPLTEAYATNVLQVTVNLSWTNSGFQRTRSMTTFVSRYGIQNYIY